MSESVELFNPFHTVFLDDDHSEQITKDDELVIAIQFVGSYESSLHWRQRYLEWLDNAKLYGYYRVKINRKSRTWTMQIFFEDARDAVLFKLICI